MAIVSGLHELLKNIEKERKNYSPERYSLQVGYSAEHALWVHESREMKLRGKPRKSGIGVYWGPKGRAGFLTDVAREKSKELVRYLRDLLRKGGYWTWKRAVFNTGTMLRLESQKNVPVEYRDLIESAFVRVAR